jgi:hypothetical protein
VYIRVYTTIHHLGQGGRHEELHAVIFMPLGVPTVDILCAAAGDGRLTLAELDERVGAASAPVPSPSSRR